MPVFAPTDGTLVCPDCLDRFVAELEERSTGCAGCGRVRPGLRSHHLYVAQRHLVVVHGRLCFACAIAEGTS